ncbi:WbuC family cupin fold metalloprotein [Chitinivorax sp. PXF-14]|uniref:WbuC family cupin fold metalloprotein n=1 Tax=Chitinivorax sp. PXF-14 TaxID=3230488 RepID=UPI00346505F0
MTPALLIDQDMLNQLSANAAATPRQRLNRNFHTDNDDASHRLIIAIEPGSYIPPHCHMSPSKDETIVVLRGRLGVLIFDAAGNVTQQAVLAAGGDNVAVNLPHGAIHTLIGLEPGSVFFESKAGPYAVPTPDERPAWAPLENSPEAGPYHATLRARFAG